MAPNNNMTGQQASLDTIAALAGVVSASSSAASAEAVNNNSTTNDDNDNNNNDDDNQRLQSTNSTDYYAKGSAELATESALTLAKIQHVSYIILYLLFLIWLALLYIY